MFRGLTNDNWNGSTCFDSAIAIFYTKGPTGRFFSILGGFGSGRIVEIFDWVPYLRSGISGYFRYYLSFGEREPNEYEIPSDVRVHSIF